MRCLTSVGERVLEPVHVIALLMVEAIVCAATLGAHQRAVCGGLGTVEQEAKLNRLN